MAALDYRQRLVDASADELRRQVGEECVDQSGTRLEIDGSFKMARVLEAVVHAAFPHDVLIGAIGGDLARILSEFGVTTDVETQRLHAVDILSTIKGTMLAHLDPLP